MHYVISWLQSESAVLLVDPLGRLSCSWDKSIRRPLHSTCSLMPPLKNYINKLMEEPSAWMLICSLKGACVFVCPALIVSLLFVTESVPL